MKAHIDLPAEDRGLLNRPHSLAAESNPTAPTSSIPVNDVRTALKQLGLNLEPAEAPMDFVVIDHIEKPLTR
jgi:uncharacterized protein (TIGR03435 family)